MREIETINLTDLLNGAERAASKSIESQLSNYIKGLILDEQNLFLMAHRLRDEADKAAKAADEVHDQIERIRSGHWPAIDIEELRDSKQDKKGA